MKNEFNFATFCSILEEKKEKEVVENFGENYVYMVIQNQLGITQIDFTKFSFSDLIGAFNGLDQLITDEDTSGRIAIDPNHSYTQVLGLGYKINRMVEQPKYRPASPFLFL